MVIFLFKFLKLWATIPFGIFKDAVNDISSCLDRVNCTASVSAGNPKYWSHRPTQRW